MNSYVLGIVWGIGRHVEEGGAKYFMLRHTDKCFLEVVRAHLENDNTIYPLLHKGEIRYNLKIDSFPIEELRSLGWTERSSDERAYPNYVESHSDFLRAYLELHSTFSYQTSYKNTRKKEGKYYRLRFRVFGNISLIEKINDIFVAEIGIKSHQPQITHNGKTAYLQLADCSEIEKILRYIEGVPHNTRWWEEAEDYMSNRTIE